MFVSKAESLRSLLLASLSPNVLFNDVFSPYNYIASVIEELMSYIESVKPKASGENSVLATT
jgi:hypothetical protein